MSCTSDKIFLSIAKWRGQFLPDEPEQEVIKNEPMFFNCSPRFAYDNGGHITRNFISALGHDWDDGVFDSRIHMLMPGWYPSIPGWHHDDVPRPFSQPDYDTPSYHAEHVMGLVNGSICPTQFAIGQAYMPAVPEGELIYRTWHPVVEAQLAGGSLALVDCPSLQLVFFDAHTFHQGRKAVNSGWRWFGRVTRKSDRCKTITNEIRRQVQVYLEFPMEGW